MNHLYNHDNKKNKEKKNRHPNLIELKECNPDYVSTQWRYEEDN